VTVVTYSAGPLIVLGSVPATRISLLEWTRPVIEPPPPVQSRPRGSVALLAQMATGSATPTWPSWIVSLPPSSSVRVTLTA
jgi:hypothetical protein